jgi:hypothetical protein
LKQGWEILKKGPAQQLKNENRNAIRARGFMRFCLESADAISSTVMVAEETFSGG